MVIVWSIDWDKKPAFVFYANRSKGIQYDFKVKSSRGVFHFYLRLTHDYIK